MTCGALVSGNWHGGDRHGDETGGVTHVSVVSGVWRGEDWPEDDSAVRDVCQW